MHLVVGAGAVGIGLGATLLAAAEPVCFVARGRTRQALERDGCARSGMFGDVSFPPTAFRCLESAGDFAGELGAVWVATKSGANAQVARELAANPNVRDGGAPIVLAQNGLGNAELFAAQFARNRVFNASVITGFRTRAAGRVEVTVHADPILIGSLFSADEEDVRGLATALTRGGIPAGTTADFGAELWAKALYNCALNPLGAILGVPYGALGRAQTTRNLMDRVVQEVFAVMQASGAKTRWSDASAYLRHFYASLLPATEDHESSMLQDVRAGRRTEIEALCGEIARRGAALSVATPVNEALAVLVRALEGRSRRAEA